MMLLARACVGTGPDPHSIVDGDRVRPGLALEQPAFNRNRNDPDLRQKVAHHFKSDHRAIGWYGGGAGRQSVPPKAGLI